jgi:hypothetical protein
VGTQKEGTPKSRNPQKQEPEKAGTPKSRNPKKREPQKIGAKRNIVRRKLLCYL